MTRIASIVLMTLVCCSASRAALERHVRIVLDTSQSMRGTRTQPANDPSGLALISSAMFYDLAKYELGADGTFKLRTFDAGASGPCPSTVPKSVSSPWIPVTEATRSTFVNAVLGLHYDAPCTYFSPYLNEAARDLESTRFADDVKRIVVLITDGLTETASLAEEQALLTSVAKRFREQHIDLYVLAFGATASANGDEFRRIFRFGQAGGNGGQVLTDPGGRELENNMIEIFKTAFAYQSDVVTGDLLDLAKGTNRRAVAVLGHYDSAVEPSFSIAAPHGSLAIGLKGWATAVGRSVPDVVPKGSSHPISYAVQWVLNPALAEHRLIAKGPAPSRIAILRPVNVMIKVAQLKPFPADVAMVDAQMHLNVVVTPAEGKGDPGPMDVQFRTLAVKTSDGTYEYAPTAGWLSATSSGAFAPPAEGRSYEIRPTFGKSKAFSKAPLDGKLFYDGYIEVRAQVQGNVVATAPNQHQVRIYQWLSVRPEPDRGTAAHGGDKTLHGAETGCTDFTFHVEGALDNAEYTLSAIPDKSALSGPLDGASLYLDGAPIKAWENGRKLGKGTWDKRTHQVCILPARNTGGGTGLSVPIRFSLWQAENDPYKQLDVVQPFFLLANIEPPSFLQHWTALLLLLLTLLILALLYWFFGRLGFPDDLRTATANAPDAGWVPQATAQAGGLNQVLRGGARAVLSSSGNRQLGRIVPVKDDLYSFRPESGYQDLHVQRGSDWVAAPDHGEGGAEVAAHRSYRLRDSDGRHHYFRIEYDSAPRNPR